MRHLQLIVVRHLISALILCAGLSIAYHYFAFSYKFYLIIMLLLIGWATRAVLSRKSEKMFQRDTAILLMAFSDYLVRVTGVFLNSSDAISADKLRQVIANKLTKSIFTPYWLEKANLSPAQRQGHTFFLTKLKQVAQLLFSLQSRMADPLEANLIAWLNDPLKQATGKLARYFSDLASLIREPLTENQDKHWEDAISSLEIAFQQVVPYPLELLDMSKDYIALADIVYNLKDLQKMQLKLAEALR